MSEPGGDLDWRDGKKEGRNVLRGLARAGWDLLVINLFSVEKARDEARELPTVDTLSVTSESLGVSYLQTSLEAQF